MAVLKSFPIAALQKDNFQDENLEMVQGNSASAWGSLKNHPMLSGRLITGISVSATATSVAHKLGRVPKGYFLASATTPIVIYTTGMDNKFLKIASSGPDTISLWVF